MYKPKTFYSCSGSPTPVEWVSGLARSASCLTRASTVQPGSDERKTKMLTASSLCRVQSITWRTLAQAGSRPCSTNGWTGPIPSRTNIPSQMSAQPAKVGRLGPRSSTRPLAMKKLDCGDRHGLLRGDTKVGGTKKRCSYCAPPS